MSAVWALKRIIPHSEKETLTPGIEIEENPVFGLWNSFMEFTVNLPVSGIKPIVPCHLEILFRDVLNKQFNKINGRKRRLNERIVFMLIVMKSYHLTVIGINPGKGNDRTAKIAADICNNGFGVTEIGFGINVKPIFVLMVNGSFYLFKGGADVFFQFIQQNSLKGFTEVGIIEICDLTPKAVIRKTAFRKEAVDMWIPFEWPSKGMEDADKPRDKVFGFIQGEKEFFDDIGNSLKETVEQVTILKEKMA